MNNNGQQKNLIKTYLSSLKHKIKCNLYCEVFGVWFIGLNVWL